MLYGTNGSNWRAGSTARLEYAAHWELDMGNVDNKRMYFKAISKLTRKGELFDLEPNRLSGILYSLSDVVRGCEILTDRQTNK
jgi:hypothetical protein